MNRNQYELYHHGIKGMKWGVRRFQDEKGRLTNRGKERYSEDRIKNRDAKRKQKAQKYYDKANEKQKQIDALYKERDDVGRIKKSKININIKRLEKKKAQDLKDAEAKEQGKLTRKQKYALVGASVVAAYATYKFVDSGHATQMIAKGKAALGHTDLEFKKNIALSRKGMDSDEIMSSVVKRINPNYGAPGTKNNCRRCTFAYEMSRRGYDVKATRTLNGVGQSAIGLNNATSTKYKGFTGHLKRAFEDDEYFQSLTETKGMGNKNIPNKNGFSKSIFEALSNNPDGARGELGVKWKLGGGHSMAWEIVKGKPVVFDCQTGEKYESIDDFAFIAPMISNASYTRLDNIDLDTNFLLRWLQNA